MRPETVIQRAIRAEFAAHGFQSVAVPNGAVLAGGPAQRARQVNALKGDGMMLGFADLLIYGSNARIGHVEVKTATGKQSPAQFTCQAWLEGLGHVYAVLRSPDDVKPTLELWRWI